MLKVGDCYIRAATCETVEIRELGTINKPGMPEHGKQVVTCISHETGREITVTREFFESGAFRRVPGLQETPLAYRWDERSDQPRLLY